jgi:anti-sigma regulatory factor (Ser/Thr protein kinase)
MSPTRLPTCVDVLVSEGLGDPELTPVHSLVLPATAEAPRDARIFAWGVAPPLDDDDMAVLGLLTSELVTNGVLHARTELTYSIAVTPDLVLVAIGDGSTTPPDPPVGSTPATGRGMHLLISLAHTWGVLVTAGGKVVWFTIARRRAT